MGFGGENVYIMQTNSPHICEILFISDFEENTPVRAYIDN
jgi:hypothetical protein